MFKGVGKRQSFTACISSMRLFDIRYSHSTIPKGSFAIFILVAILHPALYRAPSS